MLYHVSADIKQKIDNGATWMVVEKVTNAVIDAFQKRDDARSAKNGDTKLVQYQANNTPLNVLNANRTEGEINPVEALQAAGLNPIVVDENTDFSKLPQFTHQEQVAVDQRDEQGAQEMPAERAAEIEQATDKADAEAAAEQQQQKAEEPAPPVETAAKPVKPPKPDIRRKSEIEKPTRMVHAIADSLYAADPTVARKDILKACEAAGIAYNTALTQYQAWRSNQDAKPSEEPVTDEDGEAESPAE